MITYRRRIVQFVQKWVVAVRHAVFEDPIAVDFIEVCFSQKLLVYQNTIILFDGASHMEHIVDTHTTNTPHKYCVTNEIIL